LYPDSTGLRYHVSRTEDIGTNPDDRLPSRRVPLEERTELRDFPPLAALIWINFEPNSLGAARLIGSKIDTSDIGHDAMSRLAPHPPTRLLSSGSRPLNTPEPAILVQCASAQLDPALASTIIGRHSVFMYVVCQSVTCCEPNCSDCHTTLPPG
jgi:hypothetical protein